MPALVRSASLGSLVWLAACAPTTYPSRVSYEPLVLKLASAGEDPSAVREISRAADLDALERGRRYKFVVRADGVLVVAPRPADEPHNEYVHPVLGRGGPVRTAGGLTVDGAGGARHVTVDQDSKAYCPAFASLKQAVAALERAGVPAAEIARADHPPACAP